MLLTFRSPYNLLHNTLDRTGLSRYKLKHSPNMPVLPGASMRIVKSVLPQVSPKVLPKLLPGTLPALLSALLSILSIASLLSVQGYAATADRISGALTSGQTVTLRGNVHRKALPQFDQGPVDPAMRLGTITLMTLPTAAQQKALTQLLAQQQDRKSPNYHKWLTPEQFADRFGLSQNDIQHI